MHRERPLDALFIHTQVPSVLVPDWVRKVPSVVSLDATPMQYDELGAHYDHTPGNERVERLKWRLNRASLERARRVVTWSAWAKSGVVDGYGIDAAKVVVLPPGVDSSLWRPAAGRDAATEDVVRILFVGGDLERKGGDVLLDAFRVLHDEQRASGRGPALRLDLITRAELVAPDGVHVHRGMTPNAPELIALYHAADIFALPTRADCLGIALIEAGAAGLPLVSTAIAGVPEVVREDETGIVVPPDDRAALVAALRELIEHPELRRRLGAAASELVGRQFDAVTNTHRLVELMTDVAIGAAAADQ
jgi:glycosyltransferase involved in cell wall biosynthesis